MSDKLTAKEVALIIHENGKMNERNGGSDKEIDDQYLPTHWKALPEPPKNT